MAPLGLKVKKEWIDRLSAALQAKFPDQYPFPEQELLLGRIIYSYYFCWHRYGHRIDGWGLGEWVHQIGRDRRNQKEMLRLYNAGIREYNGHPIYGGKCGEPYIKRFDTEFVMEVIQDIAVMYDHEDWREVRKLCDVPPEDTGFPPTFRRG